MVGLGLLMDPRPVTGSEEELRVGPVCPTIVGLGYLQQVEHLMQGTSGPFVTNLNTL